MGAGIQPHTRLGRSHALDFLIVTGFGVGSRQQGGDNAIREQHPTTAAVADEVQRRHRSLAVTPDGRRSTYNER